MTYGGPRPRRRGDLLVRGGTVVRPVGAVRADVRIRDGRIAEIGATLPIGGETVLDAEGLHILPGVIDAHSHQWEEGMASRPDFRDDTASAAAGGITTILDHPLTPPEVLDRDRLLEKAALGERTSLVDFGLHGGASPDRLDDLSGMWAEGATSLKVFTCVTGVPMAGFLTESQRRAVLRRVAKLDAIAIVHAEEQEILDTNRARLTREKRTEPSMFGAWRSPEAELTAILSILRLARATGARVYFVHTSLPEGVDAVVAARRQGQPAYVETCPHYLVLTDDDIRAMGHWATSAPPVRDAGSRTGLRARLQADIDTVGSDHGSVLPARKQGDVFSGQPGLPGNELMVPLLLDLVAQGVLSLERLAALVSENPARLFGVAHCKGALRVGLDGDLTIIDLASETVVEADKMVSVARWSPYQGRRLRGRVATTVVRGTIVARDGRPEADPGFGRWVRRVGPPGQPPAVGGET